MGGEQIKLICWTKIDESFEIKQGEKRTIKFTLNPPAVQLRPDPFSQNHVISAGEIDSPIWYEIQAIADLDHVTLDPTAAAGIMIQF